ncbi:hypothetical protein PR048_015101 [Dryococelus australis]|uniref:Uncharacterized protein n=1 Tax=Dryococelus australis TaxID=614101 RepID=A0ABQ9HG21_9NEOP|nr:hypothetical protein PR048_015101 [Dryococelus australis]
MAITEWFEVDRTVPGHKVVSDSDIVKRAKGQVETDDSDEDEALIREKHIHLMFLLWNGLITCLSTWNSKMTHSYLTS